MLIDDHAFLSADTKSRVQTHTFCTTQIDKNAQTVLKRHWSLNRRVTDTNFTEHFATALEAEPQGYRHILNTIVR